MQIPNTFECPQCGAPIPFHYGELAAVCQFCGSTIIVPAALRPPPPTQLFPSPYPPSPPQPIAQPPPAVPPTLPLAAPTIEVVAGPTPRRKHRSCSPLFTLVAVLLIASGIVLVFVAYRTPFLIDNLVAGGFARLDKTYGPTSGADRIDGADGVAVDGAGNISVVTGPGRVFRFAPDGGSLPGWSLDGNNLSVHTIKADASGNLYILSDGAIHKQDGATGFDIKTIAVDDVFGFYDLALAPDGSLLSYLGGTTDRLVRFDPGGSEVARYPNPISEITGAAGPPPWQVRLTIAPDGTIYLLNQDPAASSPILAYTPGGKYKDRFGAYGDAQDQLQHPQALATDSQNRIYIGDTGAVKIFDPSGKYVGIARMPFSGLISGMTFDKNDHLYVVSQSESKVYRFALNEP